MCKKLQNKSFFYQLISLLFRFSTLFRLELYIFNLNLHTPKMYSLKDKCPEHQTTEASVVTTSPLTVTHRWYCFNSADKKTARLWQNKELF